MTKKDKKGKKDKKRTRGYESLVQQIIKQDTCGHGDPWLEAPALNEFTGKLFNYPELWF